MDQQSSSIDQLAQHPHWDDYANAAQTYLDREQNGQPMFDGTGVTGQMLANAAKNTFVSTGKYIPPEFALAQGQLESKFGTMASRPGTVTNPYNVGEFDNGTKQTFRTLEDGVGAYYNTVAKDYLTGGKTTDDLMRNYVNYNGNRYASNMNYEQNLRQQAAFIRSYITKNQ